MINEQVGHWERWKSKGAEIEQKRKVLEDWEKLNELIGCSTGKKFRTFAQSHSLDALVFLANKHLKELEPRYRIERETDENNELGLLIETVSVGKPDRSAAFREVKLFWQVWRWHLVSNLARGKIGSTLFLWMKDLAVLIRIALRKQWGLQELRHRTKQWE